MNYDISIPSSRVFQIVEVFDYHIFSSSTKNLDELMTDGMAKLQADREYLEHLVEAMLHDDEDQEPETCWFSSGISCVLRCFEKVQIFPEENDGVPPCCHHKLCPLSNTDNYINGNSYVKRLGGCGLVSFDRNRAAYFGFASLFTVFAFLLTLWGCFSLSTKNAFVQRTYWVGGNGHNIASGQDFSMYVGLRSFEYVDCKFEPGYRSYPDICNRQSIMWTDDKCQTGPLASACQACSSVATTMWATAFFGCFGLILSFLGAQTRMRPIADIPVQKLLGVVSEFWGFFSLAYALFTFERSCFFSLRNAVLVPDIVAQLYVGPGLYCYAICCISALIRMGVHWMTPLPGESGCGGKNYQLSNADSATNSKRIDVEMAMIDSQRDLERPEVSGH